MLRLAIRELRFHPSRFAAVFIAIAISIGFMVAASVFTATMQDWAQAQSEGTWDAAALANAYDVWKWLLWGFAGIAMVVGIITISNIFTIWLVRRQRQIGLLRVIGASGKQLRYSVLLEAVLLGFAGALGGCVLGIGVGAGLSWWARGAFAGISLRLSEICLAIAMGVILSALAAFLPALRGTRIAPLAALRAVSVDAARRKASIARWIVCSLIVGSGLALQWYALHGSDNPLLLAVVGSMIFSIGFLFSGVLYFPKLLFIVGKLLENVSPVFRLAVQNLIRNPRRAASTSTALMLAMGLIVTGQVGASSIRKTMLDGVAERFQGAEAADITQMYEQAIFIVMAVVTALLGVAVLVALIGVSNALLLSVTERSRESALLRSLGMQKSGLRNMLLIEALILALLGSLVGVGAGAYLGWIGVQAVVVQLAAGKEAMQIAYQIDVGWTLGMVALVSLVAVLASLFPGRKAAQVSLVDSLVEV